MGDSVFGFERPEDSPGFLLWQITTSWQRIIKHALASAEITHTDFVILAATLWFREGRTEVSQSLISMMTKIDKMTVSKAIKKLVKDGLMTRVESEQDTRSKCLGLTPKGRKLISKFVPVVERVDEHFFGRVSPFEQRQLLKILRKLSR